MTDFQKTIIRIGYFFLGFLAFGNFLDAVNNSLEIISPTLTYVGTFILVAILVFITLYKKFSIKWILKDGKPLIIKRFKIAHKLALIGILVLLWIPRIHDFYVINFHKTPRSIDLAIGETVIHPDQINDIVYCIPDTLSDFSSFIAFLPIYIRNNDRKTIEDVTISITYGESSDLAVPGHLNQSTLGIKDSTQISRRTESFENTIRSYISIKDINPEGCFLMNEPIELINKINQPFYYSDTIYIEIFAKDKIIKPLLLRVKCFVGNYEQVVAKYKMFIFPGIVQHRQQSTFFAYLRESLFSKRMFSTIIVPELQNKHTLVNGTGRYISNAMHDKLYSVSYNSTPFKYLFSPYKRK